MAEGIAIVLNTGASGEDYPEGLKNAGQNVNKIHFKFKKMQGGLASTSWQRVRMACWWRGRL